MQEENSRKRELFAIRLKGLRGRAGLNQSELAAKLGVSPGSVGNWESMENLPQMPVLRKIADFFEVKIGYLIEDELQDLEDRAASAERVNRKKDLALKEGEGHYDSSERRTATDCPDPKVFILEWFGDSMEPRIFAGDRLVVSPNATLESGDLVVAKKESGELFVRIYIGGAAGSCTLVAYNPVYPPMECKRADFKFIYPVCQITRQTKVRGLYQPEQSGNYPTKPEKVITS